MFGPAVEVSTDTDSQARLLARLGRDPSWQPRPRHKRRSASVRELCSAATEGVTKRLIHG
jgi:hypothetical protein